MSHECFLEEVTFGQSPYRKIQALDRQEESSVAGVRECRKETPFITSSPQSKPGERMSFHWKNYRLMVGLLLNDWEGEKATPRAV